MKHKFLLILEKELFNRIRTESVYEDLSITQWIKRAIKEKLGGK